MYTVYIVTGGLIVHTFPRTKTRISVSTSTSTWLNIRQTRQARFYIINIQIQNMLLWNVKIAVTADILRRYFRSLFYKSLWTTVCVLCSYISPTIYIYAPYLNFTPASIHQQTHVFFLTCLCTDPPFVCSNERLLLRPASLSRCLLSLSSDGPVPPRRPFFVPARVGPPLRSQPLTPVSELLVRTATTLPPILSQHSFPACWLVSLGWAKYRAHTRCSGKEQSRKCFTTCFYARFSLFQCFLLSERFKKTL